jgi:hypothetical protein
VFANNEAGWPTGHRRVPQPRSGEVSEPEGRRIYNHHATIRHFRDWMIEPICENDENTVKKIKYCAH